MQCLFIYLDNALHSTVEIDPLEFQNGDTVDALLFTTTEQRTMKNNGIIGKMVRM